MVETFQQNMEQEVGSPRSPVNRSTRMVSCGGKYVDFDRKMGPTWTIFVHNFQTPHVTTKQRKEHVHS